MAGTNRRTWIAAAAIGAVLAAGAPALSGPAPASTPSIPVSLQLPEGALVAPGPAADFELLFTGDVIGYIEPCG